MSPKTGEELCQKLNQDPGVVEAKKQLEEYAEQHPEEYERFATARGRLFGISIEKRDAQMQKASPTLHELNTQLSEALTAALTRGR